MLSELHHFKTGRRNFLKAAIGYYSCRGVAAATRRFAKHLTKARAASSFLFTPWPLRKHCTDHGPPIKAGVRTDQSTDEQAGPPPTSACLLYRKAHGLSSFCPLARPKLSVTFTSSIITQSQRAVERHGTARACSCGGRLFLAHFDNVHGLSDHVSHWEPKCRQKQLRKMVKKSRGREDKGGDWGNLIGGPPSYPIVLCNYWNGKSVK